MVRTLVIAALLAGGGCAEPTTAKHHGTKTDDSDAGEPTKVKVVVVSRLKGLEYYPCEQCHRHAADGAGTIVNAHSAIRVKHMPGATCKTCHNPDRPGELRLASGTTVALEEGYKLCGQCHSTEVADWQVGIHGKQVGNWQTGLQRFACTNCHNPHSPNYGTMIAVPPPPFPNFGIPKGDH